MDISFLSPPLQTRLAETIIAIGLFLVTRASIRSIVRATLLRSVFKSKEEREVNRLLGGYYTSFWPWPWRRSGALHKARS